MKIRNGFVSNSSSSSFVVIERRMGFLLNKEDWPFCDTVEECLKNGFGKYGRTEFGWGPEIIENDPYSMINFAYAQAESWKEEWMEMLIKVIADHFNTPSDAIKFNFDENENGWTDEPYVDHQSSSSSGENTEIFYDEGVLKYFLFGKNSKIILDNDNH